MHGGTCTGIDNAKRKERIEKFDNAIEAMTELALSFDGYERTKKEMKEAIGDLVVAKTEYVKNGAK